MAFTATFYNVSDPPNKIDKTLGEPIYTATCTPFESVSDLHGSILIDWSAAIETANYVTISGNRPLSCFVKDIVKEIGSRARVIVDIDPLTTNATELKACDCICETTTDTNFEKSSRYIANSNLKVTEFTIHGSAKKNTEDYLEIDNAGFVVGIYS